MYTKSWCDYFRTIAHSVKLKSKDKNTQIGSIIVGPNNEIRSTGYNSFPCGIEDFHEERQERPEKYFWFEHAERAAIFNAAKIGVSTNFCTMFLTCDIPCIDCTRAIINSGIKVVFCEKNGGSNSEIWKNQAKISTIMMQEAKIKLFYYEEAEDYQNYSITKLLTQRFNKID